MASFNRSSKWFRIVSLAVVAATFVIIGRLFFQNWKQVPLDRLSFDYRYLALALLLQVPASAYAAWLWVQILRLLGERPPFIPAWRINVYSQLVRYLPGRVWNFMGKMHWCAKIGIPERKSLFSSLLEMVFLTMGGVIIALYSLKLVVFNTYILVSLPLLAAALVALHPRVLERIINTFGRRWTKGPVVLSFGYGSVLLLCLQFCALWLLNGLQLFLFVRSFYRLEAGAFWDFSSFNSVSWLIGYFSFITPSGLGIKEGVFIYVFKHLVPLAVAVMSAVLIRLFSIATDLLTTAAFFAFDRGSIKAVIRTFKGETTE
ncbi:MAG TPA: lysylphosphatidylglycerol synthase domain-containing protein [Candidatus Edwardsbacteria bacterium]|nr:lysylphosphatidylglycerol synthase domain-containing protein [Candidatus Edwardsbacteria bacterium]